MRIVRPVLALLVTIFGLVLAAIDVVSHRPFDAVVLLGFTAFVGFTFIDGERDR